MKRYAVKSEPDRQVFLDVLRETNDDIVIRVTRIKNGYQTTIEEILARHLFNLCIKTGYISEIRESVVSVA